MFDGAEFVTMLEKLGVTHVVWVPDSTFGAWEADLVASPQIDLVRICREGEAWPLAAGLHIGGKTPMILMQTTGFFESGDAMRNVLFDLSVPVYAIIGVRNWLHENSLDSARRYAEPLINAWDVDQVWIHEESDKPKLAAHFEACRRSQRAGLALLAEGKG